MAFLGSSFNLFKSFLELRCQELNHKDNLNDHAWRRKEEGKVPSSKSLLKVTFSATAVLTIGPILPISLEAFKGSFLHFKFPPLRALGPWVLKVSWENYYKNSGLKSPILQEGQRKLFFFNWRIIALQCCVVFLTMSISHKHIISLPFWAPPTPLPPPSPPLYVITEHWAGLPCVT